MSVGKKLSYDEYRAEQRVKHAAYAGFIFTIITTLGLFIVLSNSFTEAEIAATGYPRALFVAVFSCTVVALIAYCSWRLFKYKSWKSALVLIIILTCLLISSFMTKGRPNAVIAIAIFFMVRGLFGAWEYKKINDSAVADVFT